MSRELQPPLLSVSLVKTELPTVIKDEPSESEIVEIGIDDILDSSESEEEIISDVKDIDIVYHPVCEEPIKSEILESYHCESVETQVSVKAENSPFIETENITQRNKTEDISDEIVTKGTGQEVVKVQALNEHSNTLSKLETDEQSVLNFSKDLNSISVRSRKLKNLKKTDIVECYKTDDTTLWEKEKEKIKIIKAPVIPVEAHEYISLAKDRHICNHCQYTCNRLDYVKVHIKKMHKEVTTMYQCPYCPYKSKWSLRKHIIQKHKHTNDIQWFQCNLCEKKFKLKNKLTEHMKVHLKHKQIQDGLDLKRYHCNNCGYKTDHHHVLKRHKLNHLKPEDIQYFYCYHCFYKSKRKSGLKNHIFTHHFKNVKQRKVTRHHCDNCYYKTDISTHFKKHKLTHLKPEEIQYFYCYHCSYKAKWKEDLKEHIFRHFKNGQVKFDCYICNFVTSKRESIIKHIKKHSKVQNKSEINEGSE